MAYNVELAARVRELLGEREGLTEKKMFGGLSFLLGGKMCCGVVKDELVVRVGSDSHDEALAELNARPMTFTGRPMKGFVYVGPEGYGEDEALSKWVQRGVVFASSLL